MDAQVISIASTKHVDLLKSKLDWGLKLFAKGGLKIDLTMEKNGEYTFLSCCYDRHQNNGRIKDDPQLLIKNYLADVISDIILYHWEAYLLKDIIWDNYYYYVDEDKNIIFNYALRHVNRNADGSSKSVYRLNRKNIILKKLLEYLKVNDDIVIDGFIRFRLKEYINELRYATDKAVDDFLLKKEYNEFIQLLQYFVDIQEPQVSLVHVLIDDRGIFKLYDQHMHLIRREYAGGFLGDITDCEINYEDMLISVLVTIAPPKIIFHYNKCDKYAVTIDTLKQVFEGKFTECVGCELCNP